MSTKQDAHPQAGAGRPLPKKEADLFKNVVKQYEMKQYKKAIKSADAILKKYPQHGETMAMKGLAFNYVSKKEEAHELVKLALRHDMRSHVCWHVYGLLHRADRNYNEAIKAYKQALRIDPENQQILRDLSMLQVQMRDLLGFASTRHAILNLKSSFKAHWLAFAIAKQLTGDLRGAIQVVDAYVGTLDGGAPEKSRGYESSELAMYRNSLVAQIPDNYAEALDHLTACESIVVDRGAWLCRRTEYQLQLRRYSDAIESILVMFRRGMTENHVIHSMFMCALLEMDPSVSKAVMSLKGTQTLATYIPLSAAQKEQLRAAYSSHLHEFHAASNAIKRIPLAFHDDDDLINHLKDRCISDLRRGVPSLCRELCSYLWILEGGKLQRALDPADVKRLPRYALCVKMVEELLSSLDEAGKFPASSGESESPATLAWCLYLRAGLHTAAGEFCEALSMLERALSIESVVDFFEMKAFVLKNLGDSLGAIQCLDQGRLLDTKDRYINNQTAKYMLQAGQETEALDRVAMFTKHEGNPEQNLFDMQCSWYELELADSLASKSDWGRSLKKYGSVIKHFEDFVEDQFDFHTYCLRKVTLRSYISMLQYEDKIFGEDLFCRAANGSISIFLHIDQNPVDVEKEPDFTSMTAAERKKAKALLRKQKKASEKREAEMRAQTTKQNGSGKKNAKPGEVDLDPLGKEYLKKDTLEEASKLVSLLSKQAPQNVQTWISQYDVASRKKKGLLALQALHKGRSLDPFNAVLFTRMVDAHKCIGTITSDNETVRYVVEKESKRLFEGMTLNEFIARAESEIRKNPLSDLPYRCAVAQALVQEGIGSVTSAASLITDAGLDCRKCNVDTATHATRVLEAFGSEAEKVLEKWKTLVKSRFTCALNDE